MSATLPRRAPADFAGAVLYLRPRLRRYQRGHHSPAPPRAAVDAARVMRIPGRTDTHPTEHAGRRPPVVLRLRLRPRRESVAGVASPMPPQPRQGEDHEKANRVKSSVAALPHPPRPGTSTRAQHATTRAVTELWEPDEFSDTTASVMRTLPATVASSPVMSGRSRRVFGFTSAPCATPRP